MIINIVLISIVIVSLGIIAFILLRKIAKVKILNVDTVPKELTVKAKDRILIERMKRKSRKGKELVRKKAVPIFSKIVAFFKKIIKKVYELEEKYKKESATQQKTGKKLVQQIKQMIEQAEKLKKEEKYTEAEKKFIEIISLDSKSKQAYKGLTDIYIEMKEYKQALQTGMFLIQLEKKESKEIVKKDENSQEYKTISNSHELADAYSDVGYIYQLLEKYTEARQQYEKALECEPNNPRNLDQMINICFLMKDKSCVTDVVARLEQVNPDNQKLIEYKEKINEL